VAEANSRLSIVVTSYTTERLEDIFELFDSIQGQGYPDLEVVFVAERSTELRERVESYAEQRSMINTKVVFNDGPGGLSASRNVGVREASGDIIAFADDDVVLFPDWAEEMVKTYARGDSTIGVTGPGFPRWKDESQAWLPEELYWIISCTAFTGWNGMREVRSAWGMNMSFRREAFDYCSFSEDFGQTTGGQAAWKAGPVDDAEFSINLRLRTGKAIVYNPNVRVWHKVYPYRLGFTFVRGQAYWQGYTKALLRRTYREDEDIRGLVREYDLLRRILLRLLPRTFGEFLRSPTVARKKLAITANALFHVALGYAAASRPRLAGFTRRYYS
jgi:glycosyltransferase involved in cell wall biosynthesis